MAEKYEVMVDQEDSGLLVIVQERHGNVIGPVLEGLRSTLLRIGLVTVVIAAVVLTALWGFVEGVLSGSTRQSTETAAKSSTATTIETMATISKPKSG